MPAATKSSSKTRTRMTKWPAYFPEQCPPADARNDNVQVFRLVDGTPLSAEDFRPTIVEQPHRAFEADKLCAACGVRRLSVSQRPGCDQEAGALQTA